MAYVPVADTVMLELFQRLHGQRIENTLYFFNNGGFGFTEMSDLWNQVLIWWTEQLSPVLSQDISLFGGKATDLSTSTGIAVDFTAPTPNPDGGVSNPALPGSVAICVSLRTLGRGRSSRGRNYVGGLPETSVGGNTMDLTVLSAIQTAYNGLLSLPFADDWNLVVVSRISGGVDRVAGLAQPVSSCSIRDPYVDSQRRRLTGRGQ